MDANYMEHWIPVTTSSGMFSSEFSVLLKLANGATVSFFADKNLVEDREGQFYLKVLLVSTDAAQHKELVLLPTETFETASRWVEVPLEKVLA